MPLPINFNAVLSELLAQFLFVFICAATASTLIASIAVQGSPRARGGPPRAPPKPSPPPPPWRPDLVWGKPQTGGEGGRKVDVFKATPRETPSRGGDSNYTVNTPL